ncbi:MAG: 16S rRNA (uracil(1498)-N(3))-methyltransferase [Bacteriovoracaceae bacterium]
MRAHFQQNICEGKLHLSGDVAHHLLKVVRIESGEKLMLLDGQGNTAEGLVVETSKKDLTLEVSKLITRPRLGELDMALGVVKKEALEEILKATVEMGIKNLYLVRTLYSQPLPEWSERYQKLLISALEQSNNPYLPKISLLGSLKEIPFQSYQSLVTFSTIESGTKDSMDLNNTLIFIGPEGGFSADEENFLKEKRSSFLKLPLPIMRAKTAAILATGFLLGQSLK